METINGVYLSGEELEEFRKRAINYEKFEELLMTVNDFLNSDVSDVGSLCKE
ncbi:hypothetical protein ACTHP2_14900 [Bacillus altitudinis]|uniref:hypothetical protein n=1 Tax=Bacillus altitudinis TaxID=293387 RepID=UPI00228207B6|nr:hypothetical protein [Bacillus altitudinis]MCY7631255.1 hypothetical protein [Bacillus altitudinis]MDX2366004.1 hypothetical protein [Bacillus altitudinis]